MENIGAPGIEDIISGNFAEFGPTTLDAPPSISMAEDPKGVEDPFEGKYTPSFEEKKAVEGILASLIDKAQGYDIKDALKPENLTTALVGSELGKFLGVPGVVGSFALNTLKNQSDARKEKKAIAAEKAKTVGEQGVRGRAVCRGPGPPAQVDARYGARCCKGQDREERIGILIDVRQHEPSLAQPRGHGVSRKDHARKTAPEKAVVATENQARGGTHKEVGDQGCDGPNAEECGVQGAGLDAGRDQCAGQGHGQAGGEERREAPVAAARATGWCGKRRPPQAVASADCQHSRRH